MVEDALRLIGQEIFALGARYPRLTSQGKLYIRLRFHFRYYIKQDPPPSRVNLNPLQVLHLILSVATALGDPIIQDKCDMIIVIYFSFLCLGDYTSSTYNSKTLSLENVPFSYGHSIFMETATEAVLQATKFVMIAFTTHKNGAWIKKIFHRA